MDEEPVLAVVVQTQIASDRSGVMFTVDPSTGRATGSSSRPRSGSARSSSRGAVEPDTYIVAKDGPRLLSARVGHQSHRLVPAPTARCVARTWTPRQAAPAC